jgi:arylformamidase
MKTVLLSYYIDNNSAHYVGTTKPVIKPNNQIAWGEDYNTYIIQVGNHCGTHVDAPRHFISSGKSIYDYDIMKLIYSDPFVLDCEKGPGEFITVDDISEIDLSGYDCLLIRTGFGRNRDEDLNKYLTEYPSITPELILWIRKIYKNIKCIGIDIISITRYDDAEMLKEAHVNAFIKDENYGDPLLLIEDMNLDLLQVDDHLIRVVVVPWQVKGIDSAPCTVIADLD